MKLYWEYFKFSRLYQAKLVSKSSRDIHSNVKRKLKFWKQPYKYVKAILIRRLEDQITPFPINLNHKKYLSLQNFNTQSKNK